MLLYGTYIHYYLTINWSYVDHIYQLLCMFFTSNAPQNNLDPSLQWNTTLKSFKSFADTSYGDDDELIRILLSLTINLPYFPPQSPTSHEYGFNEKVSGLQL